MVKHTVDMSIYTIQWCNVRYNSKLLEILRTWWNNMIRLYDVCYNIMVYLVLVTTTLYKIHGNNCDFFYSSDAKFWWQELLASFMMIRIVIKIHYQYTLVMLYEWIEVAFQFWFMISAWSCITFFSYYVPL